MRTSFLAAAAVLATLPACFQFEVTAQVAYAQLAVDGDLGYVSGTSSAAISQDIESAFGLGEDQGSPYGRVMIDTGVPVLAVSGFSFEESGTGTLQANFGDNLVAGVPVRTDFEMFNGKASYAFDIGIGPISIQPGLAVDYIDLEIEVRDLVGIASETVDLNAPIPLGFLRAQLELFKLAAIVEIGYIAVDVEDIDTSLLDVEALVMYSPTTVFNLFAGYRLIDFDGEGEIDGDTIDTDIQISGFYVGGGLRF